MLSPEIQTKLAVWRAKALDGTLTMEEQREAIIILRESRRSASVYAAEGKAKAKKGPTKSADELFGMLDKL